MSEASILCVNLSIAMSQYHKKQRHFCVEMVCTNTAAKNPDNVAKLASIVPMKNQPAKIPILRIYSELNSNFPDRPENLKDAKTDLNQKHKSIST